MMFDLWKRYNKQYVINQGLVLTNTQIYNTIQIDIDKDRAIKQK